MTTKKPEDIYFFIREEAYGFLSNFERATQIHGATPEEITGLRQHLSKGKATEILRDQAIIFDCNERFYQYRKAKYIEDRALILQARHPFLCMLIGHGMRVNKEVRDGWTEEVRVATMREGLRAKFFQNPELALKLLQTGDARLHEKNLRDPFWGVGESIRGKAFDGGDMLGKLLMEVRAEINNILQITIDELVNVCGYFADESQVNNYYNCSHPDAPEKTFDEELKIDVGECHCRGCPVATLLTEEDGFAEASEMMQVYDVKVTSALLRDALTSEKKVSKLLEESH